MTAFVKSVEKVKITVTGTTNTASLTKSQTIGDCVPYFTVNLDDNVGDGIKHRYIDVEFEAGPTVRVTRGDSDGTVVVTIFVVEYDTSGDISVQQGTFSITTTDTGTTETITSVTTTKAFCIEAYKSPLNSDRYLQGAVSVSFNSGTELAFDKIGAQNQTISGHYYVVATAGTDFSVIHDTVTLADTVETATTTISSVNTSKTFVYNTYNTTNNNDNVRDCGVVVDLQNATTVRARRAFDSFGGSAGAAVNVVTIEVQIVTAGDTEFSVERAECDWGDSLTKAVTVTEIDQTKAIIVPGGYQGHMSADDTLNAAVEGNQATLDFTSDTEVTGTRGKNTDPDGTTFFEVVEFVLVGGAPPSGAGGSVFQALSQAGGGLMQPSGVGASLFAGLTQAGLGSETFIGAGASLFAPPAQAGVGVMQPAGGGASRFEPPAQAGTGAVVFIGSGGSLFLPLAQSGAGTSLEGFTGAGASVFEVLAQAGVGAMRPSGVGASLFVPPAQAGIGVEIFLGSAASLFEELAQSASGTSLEGFTGAGASVFEELAQAGVGAMRPSGVGASLFVVLTQSGLGVVVAAGFVPYPRYSLTGGMQSMSGGV